MTRELRLIRRRPNFHLDVYVLVIGTAGSQAMLFFASIVLARLYSPREFGQFSIALAVASVITIFATLRLDAAVPLADDDQDAKSVTMTALTCTGVATLLIAGLLALHALVTGRVWSGLGAGTSVWTVPLMVGTLGTWTSLRMLQSRLGNFSSISVATFVSAVVQSVVQLTAGGLRGGALGLSLGYVVGRIWNATMLLRGSNLAVVRSPAAHLRVIRRWFPFCLMTIMCSVLNTISISAVVPFVALLYGVEFSGLFALAARVLALPSVLIGQAVGTVFYPKIANVQRVGGDMRGTVENATTGLFLLSVPAFGVMLLLGTELFGLAFGDSWRATGTIAAVLAPWLAASLVSSPLSGLMTVKSQLKKLLANSFIETVCRLGFLSVGIFGGRHMLGIAAYSLSGAIISTYYAGWALRLAGSGLRKWAMKQRLHLCAVFALYPALYATKGHLPIWQFASASAALTVLMLFWAFSWLRKATASNSSVSRI